jgi:bacteriorhodopsin
MTRGFVPEVTILQRERKQEHSAWLWTTACLVVLLCTLVLIAGLTWGGGRINRTEPATEIATPDQRIEV